MTNANKEGHVATRRVAAILEAMAGHAIRGLSLQEIASRIEETPSTTLRVLEALREEGLVKRLEADERRWALGIKLLSIARATELEITHAAGRIMELRDRVEAQAQQIVG